MVTPRDPQIMKDIEELASLVPPLTRVWVGGAEAPEYREVFDRAGWIMIRDLDDLDDRLRR